jgi:hypothetical protein
MKKREKALLSALVIGVLGSFAALGVFGAFTATTTNAGNEFSTGSVVLADNDSGSALFNASNVKPGDAFTKCIKVSYSGSLDADVGFYTPDTLGALAQYVNLTVTAGTQATATFPDCTGFSPAAGAPAFNGTLQSFAATYNSPASDLDVNPAGKVIWNTNDSVVFRFQATLDSNAPSSAQSTSTNSHSFVWQANSL